MRWIRRALESGSAGGHRKIVLLASAVVVVCVGITPIAVAGAARSPAAMSANPPKKKKLPSTAAINKMLPASIRSKGTMVVATSAAFAPDTYLAEDGKTIVGFVPDVVSAIGKAAGIKVEFVKTTFAGILTGIQAGRYDGGIVFKDTKLREQQASFVNFMSAGDSWVVSSSYSGDPLTPCGMSVGAGSGSAEALLLPKLSDSDCVALGKKPLDIHIFPNNPLSIIALTSGRVDAVLSSTEVAGYTVAHSGGQLKLLGKPIPDTSGLVGMAIPRSPLSLAVALRWACETIIRDGTYIGILRTWGVARVRVPNCTINGAKS